MKSSPHLSSQKGALFNRSGTIVITNSTIAGNTADQAGGISNLGDGAAGNVRLLNSIVANSTGSVSDFLSSSINGGSVGTSGVNNLIRTNPVTGGFVGVGSIIGQDPRLAGLADNGGPTQTMALLGGSPAINAGDNAFVTTPPFIGPSITDQRGQQRIASSTVDLGAVEDQITVAGPGAQVANAGTSTPFTLGAFSDLTSGVATWTVKVDWGDGSSDGFNVTSQGALPSFSHTYLAAAPFTVTVTISDGLGSSGQATFAVKVSGDATIDGTAGDDTLVVSRAIAERPGTRRAGCCGGTAAPPARSAGAPPGSGRRSRRPAGRTVATSRARAVCKGS
jgi:hypothetical protein